MPQNHLAKGRLTSAAGQGSTACFLEALQHLCAGYQDALVHKGMEDVRKARLVLRFTSFFTNAVGIGSPTENIRRCALGRL